jgi:F420-dependent oxidoreductase-like protein
VIRLPDPCLVVLVGPSGSGKSQWAAEWFRPEQVVSSDRLRALVGEGEHDQRAGTDAFAVLDLVLDRRLRRRLLTVVDSLGLDADRRRSYVARARRHGVPVVAVAFDVPAAECRTRNAHRQPRAVPAKVLTAQLRQWPAVLDQLAGDGFDVVHRHDDGPVRVVDPQLLHASAAVQRQHDDPLPLEFGLYLGNFTWAGGAAELGPRLAGIAGAAEEAGFTSFWVMDHVVQVPTVGRHWDEMLDGWTTLAFLAAHTSRATLGTLVTPVTFRNVAHLGKIVATLDVLSGGRAVCGLGAGWYQREHDAYGFPFPPVAERFRLLEDALRLLPLLWGPGSPAFEGDVIRVPEAICYPRPLQEHVPLLVGGSGERKTLRLAARYADACNLFEDPEGVRHKVDVLHRHCKDAGRDPADVRVTHRSTVLVADEGAPGAAALPPRTIAGTVADHVGRFRELAEAGVQTAMVRLVDVDEAGAIERFADVIKAFRV